MANVQVPAGCLSHVNGSYGGPATPQKDLAAATAAVVVVEEEEDDDDEEDAAAAADEDGGNSTGGGADGSGSAAAAGGAAAAPSLSRTLAEKLAGGLITEAEHDHIVRVCIEATEAIEADDTAVDAEAAAKRSAGELSAAGGSRGGGGGGGSSSNDVVVKKKTGNVVLDYPLSPPPSSNSPKLVRQAGKSPMPTNRSDQRAVQAAVQAMTKAGIPQDTCETRISDLVGFGFDAVKAALCLRQTNGDIAEAMALLLDSEDGGI